MDARFRFYQITDCGYYKRNEVQPVFGPLRLLASDIGDWIADKRYEETKTYESNDAGDILPAYCYRIYEPQTGGPFLLTLWNKTETLSENSVGALDGGSTYGNRAIRKQLIQGIVGYPSYFYINPDSNMAVSIRLGSLALTGHREFQKYITNYLYCFGRHVALSTELDDDGRFIPLGWSENADENPTRHRPRFRTKPWRNESDRIAIRRRRADIRQIIVKKDILYRRPKDRSLFSALSDMVGIPAQQVETPVGFSGSFDIQPSAAELTSIFGSFDNDAIGFDDIGFRFIGDPTPLWLGHSNTSMSRDIPVDLDEDGIAESASLYTAIKRRYTSITGHLG